MERCTAADRSRAASAFVDNNLITGIGIAVQYIFSSRMKALKLTFSEGYIID
ncbi:MAG: hypothetical protein PVI11_06395 [Candidatus Aminicenantes bacterium]